MQGLVHRASDTGLDNDILDPQTVAVSILISGYIRIEAAPSCPPELFQVLIRTLKENA